MHRFSPPYFDFSGPGSVELAVVSHDGRYLPIYIIEELIPGLKRQSQAYRELIDATYELVMLVEKCAWLLPDTPKQSFIGAKALLEDIRRRNGLIRKRLNRRIDYSKGRAYLMDDRNEFTRDHQIILAIQDTMTRNEDRIHLSGHGLPLLRREGFFRGATACAPSCLFDLLFLFLCWPWAFSGALLREEDKAGGEESREGFSSLSEGILPRASEAAVTRSRSCIDPKAGSTESALPAADVDAALSP
ncbi:hypothetical protein PG994_004908 [Apiospora phragmitis]|uniref:Uncharacterized protein n=1 Tax=Apiospora phragmitis TaxID=2905665 RepID=A0ABR1VRX4_9PEZI